jgi:hypothetical protein
VAGKLKWVVQVDIVPNISIMNPLEYYNRQKEDWAQEELTQLIQEYGTDEMTISQIADIHRRTPGSISYRLNNLGIIVHSALARGYAEYKSSDLYKEIVENGKESRSAKKITEKVKEAVVKPDATLVNEIIERPQKRVRTANEIAELRAEVSVLRADVKEMLRLMNALYDFETTPAPAAPQGTP